MKNEKTIFACNPQALDKEQRSRYAILTERIFGEQCEARELPDGYAINFAANPQTIKDAAEFVAYERLCCPFLKFELAITGENLQLRLKGAKGVKQFLKAELGVCDK